jgi:hypothetical protein
MEPRPKYRAVRQFIIGSESFEAGDPVPVGNALNVALQYGDTYVIADTARTRKQATADKSATTSEE